MIYIFESNLPEKKSVLFALIYILGIGKSNSREICKKLGFAKNYKIKDLSKEQIQNLILLLESSNLILTSDLKKLKLFNIKKLISIKSYRGFRLKQGLPIRGQRTHTNAKTSKKKL